MGTNRIEEYNKIQKDLFERMSKDFEVGLNNVKTVAGVDLAYWKVDNQEWAVCCIVVLDYKTKKVLEEKYVVDKIEEPYIPGYLAFREVPIFLKAYSKLQIEPDVLFFDGNGYLHPRHMGLATHAGIIIDKPSIGVAKSYYKINGVDYKMPEKSEKSYTDIIIGNEVYGRALRTKDDVKPIFISIGNKIDLDTATIMTIKMIDENSRIPIPTRLADLMTHKMRKKHILL
ncbi:MAG: endonuclease V [Lachnospiraceae bacterium]|nr:endonuclease V [Lachnospiraceae bacterium]